MFDLRALLSLAVSPLRFWPLMMVLALAFGIGLYMAVTAQVAAQNAWAYSDLAMVYLMGGLGALAGTLGLTYTAKVTTRPLFFKVFAFVMVVALGGLALAPGAVGAWVVFSAFKGFAHAHFYHGVRLMLTYRAKQNQYARLFSLKYFMLCAGSVVSPLLVPWVPLETVLALYVTTYMGIGLMAWCLPASKAVAKVAYGWKPGFVVRYARPLTLALLLGGLCETVYSFMIPHMQGVGAAPWLANASYSLLLLGAVGLQLPFSGLVDADRTGRTGRLMLGAVAMMVLSLPLLAFMPLAAAAVLVLLGGIGAALAVLADTDLCRKVHGASRSTALQYSELCYMVGAMGGDVLVGTAMDVAGPAWGHATTLALCALAAGAMVSAKPRPVAVA